MKIETGDIYAINAKQLDGCALSPCDSDQLALVGMLDVGKRVPEGWRVLSGNASFSIVATVCLRYEAPEA